MCIVAETFTKKGIEIGRREGLQEWYKKGYKEGYKEGYKKGREQERLRSIKCLIQSTGFTSKQAMNALKIPRAERAKYEELLKGETV